MKNRSGSGVLFWFCAALLLLSSIPRVFAQDMVGVPWTGEPGITETVDQIMARDALLPPDERGQHPPRTTGKPKRIRPDRSKLPLDPNSPRLPQWPPPDSLQRDDFGAPGAPRAPQEPSTSFLGAHLDESGFVPPDSIGDVGPTQIMVAANGRIKVFSKTGQLGPLNTTTDAFFNTVRAGSGTTDPRIRFDRLTNRWFVVIINVSTPNRVLIAVSGGPTITGVTSFTFYQFQHDLVAPAPNPDTGTFADYPTLGVDNNALYIGCNMFATTFSGTSAFVVRKSSVLNGGPVTVTAFRRIGTSSAGPFTPQGVDNDDPSATSGYFVAVDNAAFGRLILRRVSDPGGTPTLSSNITLVVPATTGPLPVVTLGSANPLDALDDRLFAAAIHRDRVTGQRTLWTAHSFEVDSNGNAADLNGQRNGSRWYQIGNLDAPQPTLIQAGTLYDPANTDAPLSYWIPGCAISGQGHMAIGCSVAGPAQFAGVAVAGRLAGDPLGQTQPPADPQPGAGPYNVIVLDPRNRWGDYSVTRVDPTDDMTFWTFQEYVHAIDTWGVRVIKLLAPPPAMPVECAPATLNRGDANINVLVTGDAAGGAGFFDPDPSYPNHISASVDGSGVTVNSVTFNSPTQLTLTLSVAEDAPTGSRTLTITNPDGRQVTSAEILAVSAGACEPCDVNCDGSINGFDIQVFVDTLAGVGSRLCSPCAADTNEDGSINPFDIQGFVTCLGG